MRRPLHLLVLGLLLGAAACNAQPPTPRPEFALASAAPDPAEAPAAGTDYLIAQPPVAAPRDGLYEGVERCTDHNPTVWHPLVKRDDAGTISCTYTHEHHDDPNEINDLFGAPAAWYGGTQEISYPWQTSGSAGPENDAKHTGYKWFVERDLPCTPLVPYPPDNGCILSYRAQAHVRGDISDQTTRFHSFSLEAIVLHDSQTGMVRHGGHINTGFLGVMHTGAPTPNENIICPPLASNPPQFTCGGAGTHRESSSINAVAPLKDHHLNSVTWYAQHLVTSVSLSLEAWGPIDAADPLKQHYTGIRGPMTFNGSRGRAGVLFNPNTAPFQALDDANRMIATADLYTDHLGNLTPACAPVSVSCVPLRLTNVRTRGYGLGGNQLPFRDHDVNSPVTGKSLIEYPN